MVSVLFSDEIGHNRRRHTNGILKLWEIMGLPDGRLMAVKEDWKATRVYYWISRDKGR